MQNRASTRLTRSSFGSKLVLLGVVAMSFSAPVMAKSHRHHAAHHRHHHHGKVAPPEATADGRYRQVGKASWYGRDFHGRRTASGESFNRHELTCAHPTLPFGTMLRVTNLRNGRSTLVRINDRGPYAEGRIIDLSYAAAKQIGMAGRGVARVRVEQVEPAKLAVEEHPKKAGS